MIVDLIIKSAENTQRVNIQEPKPITSAKLLHNRHPQNEIIHGQRLSFPNHLSPRDMIIYVTQEIKEVLHCSK
jgi:hypothetical protein